MRSLLCLAFSSASVVASAQPADAHGTPPVVVVRSAATLPAATGGSETFTGDVRISSPFQAFPPGQAGGATVTFAARARTAWHTHPRGQTLIVIKGVGLVQQDGQPAQAIREGDVVTIPPNVRHWHGAGPAESMTHIAIAEKEGGSAVTWQDKVSDQEYLSASTNADQSAQTSAKPAATRAASQTLAATEQAIPVIAAFAASSDMPGLHVALEQGLNAGLTVGEAKEILVQLYAYAGFPRSLNALSALLDVVKQRKQRGIEDLPGLEPSRAVPTGRELVVAGRANQTTLAGGPVQGPVMDFAPVINQFLQAHLFGDIFERDNLDWRSRELATVGALAATPGVEAQLHTHMQASLRVGLSPSQLRQLVETLENRVGREVAARANEALTHALASASKDQP